MISDETRTAAISIFEKEKKTKREIIRRGRQKEKINKEKYRECACVFMIGKEKG